jgi:hypothetical protein
LSQLPKNLDLLSRSQPELARLLSTLPGNRVEVFSSASGIPTARWLHGSRAVPLHSRYDPLKEARGSLLKQDLAGADYFVLLGFGLGYLLEALIEKSPNPANRYFIIESDLEILRAALAARDLQSLLSLPHLHLAWPPSGMELAEQWRRFFDPAAAQKTVFVSHAPSFSLAPIRATVLGLSILCCASVLSAIKPLNRSHLFHAVPGATYACLDTLHALYETALLAINTAPSRARRSC